MAAGRFEPSGPARRGGPSLDLIDELNAWRAEHQPESVDEFVFATHSGRPRDKDSVRERVLVPIVNRVNEIRAERGVAPLPKNRPRALRHTDTSLMLEAGAPLQKRVSRKNVQAAFDSLLTKPVAASPGLIILGFLRRARMFGGTASTGEVGARGSIAARRP
ncbi:MAG TPA: hypothetical protein VMA77_25640 [Solirubrobacteraceae bacterium]|nr:hypothetical protein [Solirubrobacteraceae bacterium]